MIKGLSSSCACGHQGAVAYPMIPFYFCLMRFLFIYFFYLIVHQTKVEFKHFGIWGSALLIDRPKNISNVRIVTTAALPYSSIRQSHRGVVLLLLFLLSIDLNVALHVWLPLGKRWVKGAFSKSKACLSRKGTECFLLFFPFFVFWVTFCSNYQRCLREGDAEPLNC